MTQPPVLLLNRQEVILCLLPHSCSFQLLLEGPELTEGRSVLLALLASNNLHAQKAAYSQAFNIASRALSLEAAADPTRPEERRIRFLLHRDVLLELANAGMLSDSPELAALASSLLLLLLEGRQAMGAGARKALDEAVGAVLPVIQSHTDLDSRLGRRLMELADPEEEEEEERGLDR